MSALPNFRELKQKHDAALTAMQEAVTEQSKPGLTEARLKELDDLFERAEKDQAETYKLLQRAEQVARIEKQGAEEFMEEREKQEFENGTAKAKRTKEAENAEKLDIFARAMHLGISNLSDQEQRAFKGMAVETRGTSTQISGTAGLGGYLVPVLLQNEIIKLMKLYSGVLQVAKVRYTSGGGQITFPSRNTTGRKAVKTSESGSIAVQDITYTQVVMDAYKYTDALKVSWELLQDSEFDILAEFTDAFSESFGRAANDSLTLGDGTGDPNGIVVASTLGKTAASAAAITLGELIDLSHEVDPAYRSSPACGYMMNDKLLAVIKKLSLAATNMGAGTWQPSFRDGAPATINGFPYWVNQDMVSTIATATKTVLFGDFSKYNVRITKDMTIMRNDALHMATGEVGFYAHARWDGELFDTTAVKHLIQA